MIYEFLLTIVQVALSTKATIRFDADNVLNCIADWKLISVCAKVSTQGNVRTLLIFITVCNMRTYHIQPSTKLYFIVGIIPTEIGDALFKLNCPYFAKCSMFLKLKIIVCQYADFIASF